MHDETSRPTWNPLHASLPTLKPGEVSILPPGSTYQDRKARHLYALARATVLLNCFRRKDIDEPEQFLAAVASVLERYDAAIIDYVTALETGIAARQTFPPSVSEVRQACEEQAEQSRRRQQRAAAEEQQLADREAAEAARQHRPSYDELREKYGPAWGLATVAERDDEQRQRALALVAEANNRLLQRGGVAHQAAPGLLVSAALERILRGTAP